MDYQAHYDRLIETRRNRVLESDTYYERHHIIPRSIGGSNAKENLIKLTAREHFVAHWLLWRIHKETPVFGAKMAGAFAYMCNNHSGKFTLSSRAFAEGREASSKLASERAFWKKRKPMSQEQRDKISLAMSKRVVSDETKVKMRENFKAISAKNKRLKSDEDKLRISKQMSERNVTESSKEKMREAWSKLTPEEKAIRAKKAWETRRTKKT